MAPFRDRQAEVAVQDILLVALGATNNQALVTAVAGKIIVCLSLQCHSAGAQTSLTFKSASGGTNKYGLVLPANTGASPNVDRLPNPLGYFRSLVGEGIYVDNTAAVLAVICMQYILVTP